LSANAKKEKKKIRVGFRRNWREVRNLYSIDAQMRFFNEGRGGNGQRRRRKIISEFFEKKVDFGFLEGTQEVGSIKKLDKLGKKNKEKGPKKKSRKNPNKRRTACAV